MNQYISLPSVVHALKEHRFWALCAAMSTARALPIGPNLRLLSGCAHASRLNPVYPRNGTAQSTCRSHST